MTRAQRIAVVVQLTLAGVVLMFAVVSLGFGNVWFGALDMFAVVFAVGFTYAQMASVDIIDRSWVSDDQPYDTYEIGDAS